MTPADAARRERALATMDEIPPDADMDWADAQEIRSDYGLGFLVAYLAGAREEAARAAEKLRAAARETRTPFGEQLLHLADEIEEGR